MMFEDISSALGRVSAHLYDITPSFGPAPVMQAQAESASLERLAERLVENVLEEATCEILLEMCQQCESSAMLGYNLERGATPLHVASERGVQNVLVLSWLAQTYGVLTLDREGATALFYAAEHNQAEVCYILCALMLSTTEKKTLLTAPLPPDHDEGHPCIPVEIAAELGFVDVCLVLACLMQDCMRPEEVRPIFERCYKLSKIRNVWQEGVNYERTTLIFQELLDGRPLQLPAWAPLYEAEFFRIAPLLITFSPPILSSWAAWVPNAFSWKSHTLDIERATHYFQSTVRAERGPS